MSTLGTGGKVKLAVWKSVVEPITEPAARVVVVDRFPVAGRTLSDGVGELEKEAKNCVLPSSEIAATPDGARSLVHRRYDNARIGCGRAQPESTKRHRHRACRDGERGRGHRSSLQLRHDPLSPSIIHDLVIILGSGERHKTIMIDDAEAARDGAPREWAVPQEFAAFFDWRLDPGRDRLLALYERGKVRQWNAADRIDWSQDLDPENPQLLPPEALPLFGSPLFARLSRRERIEVTRQHQAWTVSQFLHGEQGALICAAKIVQQVPDVDAKFYAATQVIDEARHVEVYQRLLGQVRHRPTR